MGSPKDEAVREDNEGPLHDVSVRSFALGKYPVTRGEFVGFVAGDRLQNRRREGSSHPVPAS